jgi:hypothetical protein
LPKVHRAPKPSAIPYNCPDGLPALEPGKPPLQVIVPVGPPDLGPEAAQTLLQLLIAAARKRHPVSTPEEAP